MGQGAAPGMAPEKSFHTNSGKTNSSETTLFTPQIASTLVREGYYSKFRYKYPQDGAVDVYRQRGIFGWFEHPQWWQVIAGAWRPDGKGCFDVRGRWS